MEVISFGDSSNEYLSSRDKDERHIEDIVMTTYPILVDMSEPLTPSETITFERLKSRYNYQPVGPHRTDRQQLNDLSGMACYDDDYDDV